MTISRLSKHNLEKLVFAGILLLSFFTIVYRASSIPATQDEVISFFEYVASDSSWLLDFRTANNHLLNTLLGKLFTGLFGMNMFSFRLPNALAFLVYGLGVWRISSRLKFEMKWLLILNLMIAYPIIEYFGLARGYGISFAFMILQLDYLLEYASKGKLVDLFLSTLCLGLAVLANLSLAVHLAVSTGVVILINILAYQGLRNWLPLILNVGFILSFGYIGLGLNQSQELYYGYDDGFYRTTIDTLLNMFKHSTDSIYTNVLLGTILLLTILSILDSLWSKLRLPDLLVKPKLVLTLAMFLNIVGTIALSEIIGVNYPSERVGLYFVILFLLTSAFAYNDVNRKSLRIGIFITNAILTIGIAAHTLSVFSLERSRVEPYAHLSEKSFNKIVNLSKADKILPIVCGDERLSYAYRYLTFVNDVQVNPIANSISSLGCEIEILFEPESDLEMGIRVHSDPDNLKELDVYFQHNQDEGSIEFIEEYQTISKIAMLDTGEYILTVGLDVESGDKPKISLVMSINNGREKQDLLYEAERIDCMLKQPRCEKERSWKLKLTEPVHAHFYLFNLESKKITLNSSNIKVYKLN